MNTKQQTGCTDAGQAHAVTRWRDRIETALACLSYAAWWIFVGSAQ